MGIWKTGYKLSVQSLQHQLLFSLRHFEPATFRSSRQTSAVPLQMHLVTPPKQQCKYPRREFMLLKNISYQILPEQLPFNPRGTDAALKLSNLG
ncbi:MAG: hypothetical protein EBR09_02080 [Proteobacteria bacterium]|nr:hypothetical protein [Pseudomonadota bacterium]